jgi:site-specific DNA-methyltransferase (adenine-specific)
MIHYGDCLDVMREMESESVHAVVCDPPYEFGFMGKSWDKSGIAFNSEVWRLCMEVLKPGGFLLAFSGARTYHRMACAIEDAGFVILPMLGWIYGSGFPKAADVGKAIDKREGAEREVTGRASGAQSLTTGKYGGWGNDDGEGKSTYNITAPATDLAKHWDGYKYSISPLKPALEPICMAMKPYDGKPLDSIIKHEAGAVNVKGCAVPFNSDDINLRPNSPEHNYTKDESDFNLHKEKGYRATQDMGFHSSEGRYPPNLCLDPVGAAEIGKQSGENPTGDLTGQPRSENKIYGKAGATIGTPRYYQGDSGTAARFFPTFEHYPEPPFMYCAKASRAEREAGCGGLPTIETQSGCGGDMPIDDQGQDRDRFKVMTRNPHPTVKPIALMRWLIRLVTREGQIVLDPFMGSGSTGCAAALENREFIGIDQNAEYIEIAKARIKYWSEIPVQIDLFE